MEGRAARRRLRNSEGPVLLASGTPTGVSILVSASFVIGSREVGMTKSVTGRGPAIVLGVMRPLRRTLPLSATCIGVVAATGRAEGWLRLRSIRKPLALGAAL